MGGGMRLWRGEPGAVIRHIASEARTPKLPGNQQHGREYHAPGPRNIHPRGMTLGRAPFPTIHTVKQWLVAALVVIGVAGCGSSDGDKPALPRPSTSLSVPTSGSAPARTSVPDSALVVTTTS